MTVLSYLRFAHIIHYCCSRHCAALHGLNHLGPEGYHWRVCVEDKPIPGEAATEKSFSWWDVQDENAKLPIKQASQYQLAKFFAPPKHHSESTTDAAAKAAKGAFKSFGKVMTHAVTGHDGADHGPPVSVIAFKLLDLVKMHDDFEKKNHGRGGHIPQPQQRAPRPPAARMQHTTPAAQRAQHTTPASQRAQPRRAPQPTQQRPPAPRPAARQEASLMDFGPAPTSAPAQQQRNYRHANSSPANFSNETRAEKLKREYAQKKQNSNRVWDEVDQRWVEVDPKASTISRGSTAAPPGATNAPPRKKEVGISLDPTTAMGKSSTVQAAVHARVNEMKQSQQKALQEVRDREEQKKKDEAEEDMVRKKLEPRIKAWSEEHGKKKHLRALLASLHTILWPEANWKQISIGDVLDDSKVKRNFHKASRVVHPDKTHHLDAEKRFLAKRIFDALSQAKTEFDNGAK